MAETAAAGLAIGLIVLVLGQLPLLWAFVRVLRRREAAPVGRVGKAANGAPKGAVILCLRGPDPFLADTLRAAAAQQYPNYRLFIVVDHPDDPAHRVVEETLGRPLPEHVATIDLRDRLATCTLKCSSLVQVIASLDDSFDFVALLDADTVPHGTWLSELAAALADPGVGVATGNRWYMPSQQTWGALVRHLWNSAAVVQMYCYGIPWGGTLAIKLAELRRSDLLDRWARAFCEDTMLFGTMRQLGRRVAFVPTLMMVNRESCSLAGFFYWVRRQLLTARLYHPGWLAVLFHGLITTATLAVGGVALAAALVLRHGIAAAWLASGLLFYTAAMPILLYILEMSVRIRVVARGESAAWMSWKTPFRLLVAIPVTQAVYAAALISAALVRQVEWRGVTYQVGGPHDIRLVQYHPFRAVASSAESDSL